MKSMIAASIAGVILAGCSVTTGVGKVTGKAAGAAVANQFSNPKTLTIVDPKGGQFCPTMEALGWPPQITDDRLNRPLGNAVLGALEHGEAECQWKP